MLNKSVPSHHGINQRLAREGLRAFFIVPNVLFHESWPVLYRKKGYSPRAAHTARPHSKRRELTPPPFCTCLRSGRPEAYCPVFTEHPDRADARFFSPAAYRRTYTPVRWITLWAGSAPCPQGGVQISYRHTGPFMNEMLLLLVLMAPRSARSRQPAPLTPVPVSRLGG